MLWLHYLKFLLISATWRGARGLDIDRLILDISELLALPGKDCTIINVGWMPMSIIVIGQPRKILIYFRLRHPPRLLSSLSLQMRVSGDSWLETQSLLPKLANKCHFLVLGTAVRHVSFILSLRWLNRIFRVGDYFVYNFGSKMISYFSIITSSWGHRHSLSGSSHKNPTFYV